MARNPDAVPHQRSRPHDEMPVKLVNTGPDLRSIPGKHPLVPNSEKHNKPAEAGRKRPRYYRAARLAAPPRISAVSTKARFHQQPICAFPIGPTKTPAASSFRGLSTRADTGPAAKITQRSASKNLQGRSRSLYMLMFKSTFTKRTFVMFYFNSRIPDLPSVIVDHYLKTFR